jgi:hypothetical protein
MENIMASETITLEKRRVESLPNEPGTDVHFVGPDLAIVVQRQAGGGGGGGAGATIDVCKCVKTAFKCTTTGSTTMCKEECVEWDCQTLPGGVVIA